MELTKTQNQIIHNLLADKFLEEKRIIEEDKPTFEELKQVTEYMTELENAYNLFKELVTS